MQRTYELMFIVRPDMPEEDQDKLISNLETQVSGAGGTVKSVERMGKRRLAYMVRNFQDGIYMLMTLEGEGGMVKEVERRLRVNEPVIKFITVRVDEEQKRLAKVKAIRDTKVRGKGRGPQQRRQRLRRQPQRRWPPLKPAETALRQSHGTSARQRVEALKRTVEAIAVLRLRSIADAISVRSG